MRSRDSPEAPSSPRGFGPDGTPLDHDQLSTHAVAQLPQVVVAPGVEPGLGTDPERGFQTQGHLGREVRLLEQVLDEQGAVAERPGEVARRPSAVSQGLSQHLSRLRPPAGHTTYLRSMSAEI